MAIRSEQTPNPNALKFSVGQPVGGPGTHVKGSQPEEEWAGGLLSIHGVTSVFFTADFVTVSKTPDATWDDIVPAAIEILEAAFGDRG